MKQRCKRGTAPEINKNLGNIEGGNHMLLRNKPRKAEGGPHTQDAACYLCKLRGFKSKSIYGCVACQVGFHPECFTAYHYKDALKGNTKVLVDMLKLSEGNKIEGFRKRTTKYVGSLLNFELPEQKQRRSR